MNKHLRQITLTNSGSRCIQSGVIIVLAVIMFFVTSLSDSYAEEIKSANVQATEDYESVLWIATENCNLEVVKFLVKNLIDINGARNFGVMLLRHATKKECLEIIQFLVEEKVDINSTSGSLSSRTALHYAAKQGSLEIVKFLLQNGANPNAKEFRKKKPRDLAVIMLRHNKNNKPYREIIDLLTEAEKNYKLEK